MPPVPDYYARLLRYDAWANTETLGSLRGGEAPAYWTSTVGDILTHVAMHGAYHRAQIAAAVRESGREPAYTDFIHAVRQGFVE